MVYLTELSSKKARSILRHGTAKGKKLTSSQKKYFGLIAGGKKATRLGKKRR